MDFANLTSQLNAGTILPEGIVIITLMTVLIVDLILGRTSARWIGYLAIAGLFSSIVALYFQWDNVNPISFSGGFNGDDLSIVFRGIIALSAISTILMSIRYVEQSGTPLAEFIAILLTATLGGMFLSGANELVMTFISLETLSISSYLLTGYTKRDPRSNEAALKYLLIGASSTAVFLYGVSLLYGLSGGQTEFSAIASGIFTANLGQSLGLVISLVFVIAGIGFKISAAPFHQWTPDVYEGAPTPVIAFLSVGSKAAGFALAIRLLTTVFPLAVDEWRFVFTALAVLSMVLGNVVAPRPNQHETDASLFIYCPSWVCDDWLDFWHSSGILQYDFLHAGLLVHELVRLYLRDSLFTADGNRPDRRILRFVSKRCTANSGIKYFLTFLGWYSATGWILWQNLHLLGWLASWSLLASLARLSYQRCFHLLLHSRSQNDGSQRTSRNVRRCEKLSGSALEFTWI
jgi:hypothetical protein